MAILILNKNEVELLRYSIMNNLIDLDKKDDFYVELEKLLKKIRRK